MADANGRDWVLALIAGGLGSGYAFLANLQAGAGAIDIQTRPDEQIWNAWTARLNTGLLEAFGGPSDAITVLRSWAAEVFVERAESAGLQHDKLERIGAYRGQAGAELSVKTART